MKRATVFMLSLLLIFLMPISALAAEFSAYSEGTRYNRIFTLEIYLRDESASFCGVLLDVSYDPDILEFHGADPAVTGADLDTYSTDGNVRVLFMSTDPLNCIEDTKILGLDFISKAGGSGNFDIQIFEAVDENARLMETNTGFSCPYNVTEKDGKFTVSSTKSSNFKITTSSGWETTDEDVTEVTSGDDDIYRKNHTQITLLERSNYPLIVGLIVIIITAALVIAGRIIRLKILTKKKKSLKDKTDSDN